MNPVLSQSESQAKLTRAQVRRSHLSNLRTHGDDDMNPNRKGKKEKEKEDKLKLNPYEKK